MCRFFSFSALIEYGLAERRIELIIFTAFVLISCVGFLTSSTHREQVRTGWRPLPPPPMTPPVPWDPEKDPNLEPFGSDQGSPLLKMDFDVLMDIINDLPLEDLRSLKATCRRLRWYEGRSRRSFW